MTWVLFEDNEVKKQLDELPKAYKDVSGFNNADESFVNSYNWYQLQDIKPTKKEYQNMVDNGYLLVGNIVKKQYILNNISISDYKDLRKNYIKQKYYLELQNGFITSFNIKVDCKLEDQANWNNNFNYIEQKGLTETNIRDYDNKLHTLSYEDYKTMVIEIGDHISNLMAKKWILQQEIDIKTNHEEILLIDW